MQSQEIAIIGGGICGLSTAFAIQRRGYKNITLFESQTWPNPKGSSHSHSRITRSAYSSPFYVELMQKAHNYHWPQLEEALNKKLIYPCKGLFFGPKDGLIQDYYEAVTAVGVHVDPITKKQAEDIFPQICFNSDDFILNKHDSWYIVSSSV